MLENTLEDVEKEVFRRARNKKQKTKPKNVDHVTYKYATALEALLGYLYLTGDTLRMDEVIGCDFGPPQVDAGRVQFRLSLGHLGFTKDGKKLIRYPNAKITRPPIR